MLALEEGEGWQCLRLFCIHKNIDKAARQCLCPLAQHLYSSKQSQDMVYPQPESQGLVGDRGTEERGGGSIVRGRSRGFRKDK